MDGNLDTWRVALFYYSQNHSFYNTTQTVRKQLIRNIKSSNSQLFERRLNRYIQRGNFKNVMTKKSKRQTNPQTTKYKNK